MRSPIPTSSERLGDSRQPSVDAGEAVGILRHGFHCNAGERQVALRCLGPELPRLRSPLWLSPRGAGDATCHHAVSDTDRRAEPSASDLSPLCPYTGQNVGQIARIFKGTRKENASCPMTFKGLRDSSCQESGAAETMPHTFLSQ